MSETFEAWAMQDSEGYFLDNDSCANEDPRCAAFFSRREYAIDAFDTEADYPLTVRRFTIILHGEGE